MDLGWILLIFIVVAALTVTGSIVIQHLTVGRSRSPHESPSPRLLDQMARPSGDDQRLDDTDPHGIQIPQLADESTPSDRSGTDQPGIDQPGSHHDRTLRARAEELEAVAQRERRYAERAEAEARRLRASSRPDVAGTSADQRQRERRAGVAPEDLDY